MIRLSRRLLLGGAALWLAACRKQPSSAGPLGVVSLAPALTDTLFAIGAGPLVIGVSDYCDFPPEAAKLPRLGTSLTPNYEAIARLAPGLIVSESSAMARAHELEALAPTLLLPWLTLDDVTKSIAVLGRRVGRAERAEALAARLRQRLGTPKNTSGPRVLLVLGDGAGKLDEIWFVRENSLHGAALRAAGGRNAVAGAVHGNPSISQERVLELDPDVILILVGASASRQAPEYVKDWQRLPMLSAVKAGKVRAIVAPEALANGPRILKLVDRLERELAELAR